MNELIVKGKTYIVIHAPANNCRLGNCDCVAFETDDLCVALRNRNDGCRNTVFILPSQLPEFITWRLKS